MRSRTPLRGGPPFRAATLNLWVPCSSPGRLTIGKTHIITISMVVSF